MAIFGLEILMSRLHHFSALLREDGIESDILAGMDNDLPVLMIYFPAGTAQLSCLPMDQDDSFAHFILDIRTVLPVPGTNAAQRQTICDLFSQVSLAGLAYRAVDAAEILCRQILPEAQLPTSDETFRYWMSLYAENLGVLQNFIAAVTGGDTAQA